MGTAGRRRAPRSTSARVGTAKGIVSSDTLLPCQREAPPDELPRVLEAMHAHLLDLAQKYERAAQSGAVQVVEHAPPEVLAHLNNQLVKALHALVTAGVWSLHIQGFDAWRPAESYPPLPAQPVRKPSGHRLWKPVPKPRRTEP